jgi:hypothetical protein
MDGDGYRIIVEADSDRSASEGARSLADQLREIPGVLDAQRRKENQSSMDLGAVVAVVATSGATLAVARRVADWLRRTRGTTLTIELRGKATSIKAVLSISDPQSATRIREPRNRKREHGETSSTA